MTNKITLYRGNSQMMELTGLYDDIAQMFVADAVVVATLFDGDGNEIAPLVDIQLTHVTASPEAGNYEGMVPNGFNPPVGGAYVLEVHGESRGNQLLLEIPVEVKERRHGTEEF